MADEDTLFISQPGCIGEPASIKVLSRSTYGVTRYYPGCERSKIICEELMGSRASTSFLKHHLEAIKALGFTVTIVHNDQQREETL